MMDLKKTSGNQSQLSNSRLFTQRNGTDYVSVIIRFHDPKQISFLEDALFSLAIQDWGHVEPVVVLQNGTPDLVAQVERMILRQPWLDVPVYQILCKPIPAGVDGRSALINHGIAHASGRYLAFLDYDDVIYQHHFQVLIEQLEKTKTTIAFGGTRRARLAPAGSHWFVETKDNGVSNPGNSRADLFFDNFVAIHAYVIDRSRLGGFVLQFDESLCRAEDYDFILGLCAVCKPDFTQLKNPVCEHRIRTDGSNTVLWWSDTPNPKAEKEWKRNQDIIAQKKVAYAKTIRGKDRAAILRQAKLALLRQKVGAYAPLATPIINKFVFAGHVLRQEGMTGFCRRTFLNIAPPGSWQFRTLRSFVHAVKKAPFLFRKKPKPSVESARPEVPTQSEKRAA